MRPPRKSMDTLDRFQVSNGPTKHNDRIVLNAKRQEFDCIFFFFSVRMGNRMLFLLTKSGVKLISLA